MINRKQMVITLAVLSLSLFACSSQQNQQTQTHNPTNIITDLQEGKTEANIVVNPERKTFIMKGVGIDIPQGDFVKIKNAGINVLTTEWGMEVTISRAKAFLDKANATGLKVVMDGGFSYTAWGFTNDDWDNLPRGKRPVWQKDRVQNWVKALKDHPAVFGWDICNEYGENLPSGAAAKKSEWPKTAISLEQLKQARNDVLEIDPSKPILIRTYEWDLDEPPFGLHRPFEAGLAEILMLNLYSNYLENNKLQWPTVVKDVGDKCVKIIKAKDPNAKIWVSLSAFEEPGIFKKPTTANLTRDIEETFKIPSIDGIGFFEWGPSYGEKRWYLPETGADLWEVIQRNIR